MSDTKSAQPPKRQRGNGWSGFAFANSATRREAKVLLFEELSVAVQQGMPLDEALESCMRTAEHYSTNPKSAEPASRWFYPDNLRGLLALVFWLAGLLILVGLITGGGFGGFGAVWLVVLGSYFAVLFTATMLANVERVARVLAIRLLPLVRAGHPLATAMEMLPGDYAREEVNLVRAGEGWGNLSKALQNLGQYQYYERKMLRHWARMSYPVWLLLFMVMIGLFVSIFIIPKFKDIYDQLGATLPRASQILLDTTEAIVAFGVWLPFILIWLVLFMFTIRMFMVGNRAVRDSVAVILGVATTGIALYVALEINENLLHMVNTGWVTLLVVVFVLLGLFLAMALAFQLEKSVLDLERVCSRLFGNLPLIGAPRRTEMESRWLATLSLALDSNIEAPAAVEAAGDTVSGLMATASGQAAEFVRQGLSIGQAVLKTGVLRSVYGNRLRLLDDRPGYLQGLADIAEDATRDSFQTMNRTSRIVEVASVSIIGVGVGLFAYAMYMPLFTIPLIVGHW